MNESFWSYKSGCHPRDFMTFNEVWLAIGATDVPAFPILFAGILAVVLHAVGDPKYSF